MKSNLTFLFILLFSFSGLSQNHFNTNGVHTKNIPYKVFYNATLHVSGDQTIPNGMLIIKDNIIVHAGAKIKTPENSLTYDLKGKHIYPSFIELDSNFGIEEQKKNKSRSPQ